MPQSVLEKAQQLKDKGGLSSIDNMMQNLPDLLQRNQEVIDEVTFIDDHCLLFLFAALNLLIICVIAYSSHF